MTTIIWVNGRLCPEKEFAIPLHDSVLEHGLGLFETMRTWGGRTPLLDRHLARMRSSARALGIDLDPASLPDAMAVSGLLRSHGREGDARLRITATGGMSRAVSLSKPVPLTRPSGTLSRGERGRGVGLFGERYGPGEMSGSGTAVVWMRHDPLSAAATTGGATLVPAPWPIAFDDPLARHKSLNYWSRRIAFDAARRQGADEALFATPDGRIWEGSRTSLFLIRDETLWTPGLDGPIVPGIMRGLVLELAPALGLAIREGDLSGHDLDRAEEVFLTNAVRGVIPVAQASGRVFENPGPWTLRLHHAMVEWLEREGVRP